jgi:hypothetical protein
MVTDDKRSATDILLDIEARLSTLDKRVQNSENLLKILLSRVNASLSSGTVVQSQSQQVQQTTNVPVVPSVVNKDNFESRSRTNKFTEAAASHGLNVEDDINPVDPFESDDEAEALAFASQFSNDALPRPTQMVKSESDIDLLESAASRGNSRGQRGPKTKGTKCSVSQNLVREDSPIYLATVELLDENGSLINQTRTNTKGRWMLALAPGSYQVHVLKRFPPDSGKKQIDVTYPIVIPQSDKPVELNPLTLNGDG